MELCDWLLVKDDVSRLMGDIGGVGLLHSECDCDPGGAQKDDMISDLLCTNDTSCLRHDIAAKLYLCQILQSGYNELGGS